MSGYRWIERVPRVVLRGGTVLEVGASRRGPARPYGSSEYLEEKCKRAGACLHIVDKDPLAFRGLPTMSTGAVHMTTAKAYLQGLPPGERVVFAYLDGFDWPYSTMAPGRLKHQAARYRQLGLPPLTKANSQESHLEIAELLEPLVVPGGIVAIDDTWAGRSDAGAGPTEWDGKGGLAVPYLVRTHRWGLLSYTVSFLEMPGAYVVLRRFGDFEEAMG